MTTMNQRSSMFVAFMSIMLLFSATLYSQSNTNKNFLLYPNFGIGLGFFYPTDVNEYIADDLANMGAITSGSSDMYAFFEVHGGLTYRMKQFDMSANFVYNVAPKIIMLQDAYGNVVETYTYSFQRIAPEVVAHYYFPLRSGRHAFFVGGGFNVSMMSFEQYEAVSPGATVQGGLSLQMGKFNMQPYLAVNYASASDGSFNLNYTSGQIGVILSIHKKMLYK